MRKAWRWWKEWCPLVLWPLALYLTVSAIIAATVFDNYAKGAYLLLLGHIIDLSATARAEKQLAEDAKDAE